MNNLEQRVREAFSEVELPVDVKRHALDVLRHYAEPAGMKHPPTSVHRPRILRWPKILTTLAACLVLLAVGFGAVKLYFDETAFISIDINPSLELALNRFDIVVSAKAFNEDGEKVLASVSVVGKNYDAAMNTLSSSDVFSPYLQENAYLAISVASANEQQASQLQQQSDHCLQQLPCDGSSQRVDEGTHHAADSAGMGIARYQAAQQLVELDSSLTLEECALMSMRELRSRISTLTGEAASSEQSCINPGDGSVDQAATPRSSRHEKGSEKGHGSGLGRHND